MVIAFIDTFNTVDESLGQYNDERCPEYQFPEENDLECSFLL